MMVITQDALGEEKFHVAYGMLLFVEAVGVIAGSPLAGKANDVFGSYNLAFYLSGAVLVVSGKPVIALFDLTCSSAVAAANYENAKKITRLIN